MNAFNYVFGPFANLAVNAADIFSDDPQGKKLQAHKSKKDGKEGKDAFRRPGRS